MTIFSSYACTGQAAVLCICLDSHALGHTCLVPNKDNITPVSKLVEQILRNRRQNLCRRLSLILWMKKLKDVLFYLYIKVV